MASSKKPKINIDINMDSSRFNKSIDEMKKKIKEIGKESKTADNSISKLGDASSQSASKIKKVSTSSQSATNNLKEMSSAAKQAGSSVKSSGSSASSAATDMGTLATSVLGLAQGFTGLSDAVFGFAEKAVALERSMLGLEDLTIQLRRAEEDYAEALKQGEMPRKEILRLEEDLIQLRKMHTVEIKTVSAEQEALNGEYVTFAVNIAAVSAQSIIAIKALNMTSGATKTLTAASKLLRIDLHGASLALRGFSVSQTSIGTTSVIASHGIKRASLAIKGLYMSLGPVGWAVIGITTAWQAWETNLFGFRDGVKWVLVELQKLYDMIKWLIPIVGLVDEAFKSVAPDQYAKSANAVSSSIHNIGESAESATPSLSSLNSELGLGNTYTQKLTASSGNLAQSLISLKDPTMELASSVANFYEILRNDSALDNINEDIEMITTSLEFAKTNFDLTSFSGVKALQELKAGTSSIVDEFVELGQPNLAYDFIENLRMIDAFGTKYIDSLTGKVKSLNQELTSSKKNYDETIKNAPRGSAASTDLDALRSAITLKLLQDMQNIRNKAGVITSQANQEINSRYDSIVKKAQAKMRFAKAQHQTWLIETGEREANNEKAKKKFWSESKGNYINYDFKSGGGLHQNRLLKLHKITGGRLGRGMGGASRNRNYIKAMARRDAYNRMRSAAYEYQKYFGEPPSKIYTPSGRRSFHAVTGRQTRSFLSAVSAAKSQLAKFPVDLDYAPRHFSDLIRKAVPRRLQYKSGQNRTYSRGSPAIYKSRLRTPTRKEAVTKAVQRSSEIEGFYDRIIAEDDNLLDIVSDSGLTRKQLKGYAQSPQDLIDISSKLAYHDRILLEANMV